MPDGKTIRVQSRWWLSTCNNPEKHYEWLPEHGYLKYAKFQLEIGDTGNYHWQIMTNWDRQVSRGLLSKWMPHTDHRPVTVTDGSVDRVSKYVEKTVDFHDDGNEKWAHRIAGPWELGEPGIDRMKRGTSDRYVEAIEVVKKGRVGEVIEKYSDVYGRFHSGFDKMAAYFASKRMPSDKDFVPRPWQRDLLEILKKPADDRHIIWVTDPKGCSGKSRLTRHLICEYGAVVLSGKKADMAHMYDHQPIVVFDVTKSVADCMDHFYSVAEDMKNGCIVSPKYMSQMKVFKPPHVVFFANMTWDRRQWINDRVIEIKLSEEPNVVVDCPDDYL